MLFNFVKDAFLVPLGKEKEVDAIKTEFGKIFNIFFIELRKLKSEIFVLCT